MFPLPRQGGYTPLDVAAFEGHTEVVEMLIKSKAHVNAVNDVRQ